MSQTNIPAIQLAQLGYAERIAQDAQSHPEVTRQAAQQATPGELKEQNSSVGKTEETKASRPIRADKDGARREKDGGRDGEGKPRDESPAGEDADQPSPWSGNIVNFKV